MPGALPDLTNPAAAAIGWLYLVTNAARVFAYLPQIAAVWRCTDGARAISLLTWSLWMVSHLAALLYGALVMRDTYFVVISTINFAGCATIAAIAAHRRWWSGHRRLPSEPGAAVQEEGAAVVRRAARARAAATQARS